MGTEDTPGPGNDVIADGYYIDENNHITDGWLVPAYKAEMTLHTAMKCRTLAKITTTWKNS